MSEPVFKPACPKCGSTSNFGITRMNDVYRARRDSWEDRVFACMCGKQLYGAAIGEEFSRQEEDFEQRQREDFEQRQREVKAAAAKKAAQRKHELAAQRAREEEERKAREAREAQEAKLCAWKECENEAREGSLYCSRTCNNRNARWRHKQRQTAG